MIPRQFDARRQRGGRGFGGFTLIELLVTIGVIGVMAGLLLPAAAKSKARAQQTRCLSNTRMLTMAAFMYGNDYGRRPGYTNPALPAGTWMGTLVNEIKNDGARLCPLTQAPSRVTAGKDLDGDAGTEWVRWTSDAGTSFRGAYGYNGWLYSDGLVDGVSEHDRSLFFGRGDGALPAAETPVFFDENWVDTWPLETDQPAGDLYRGASFYDRTDEIGRCAIARHGAGAVKGPAPRRRGMPLPGAINVGMADGHAALLKIGDLWGLSWHAGWQTPVFIPGL
jgi:prepilin-type N-terminal cleavage/methylation domain-containing protein/prepilin-type processing-associated H-X9-DG protein